LQLDRQGRAAQCGGMQIAGAERSVDKAVGGSSGIGAHRLKDDEAPLLVLPGLDDQGKRAGGGRRARLDGALQGGPAAVLAEYVETEGGQVPSGGRLYEHHGAAQSLVGSRPDAALDGVIVADGRFQRAAGATGDEVD